MDYQIVNHKYNFIIPNIVRNLLSVRIYIKILRGVYPEKFRRAQDDASRQISDFRFLRNPPKAGGLPGAPTPNVVVRIASAPIQVQRERPSSRATAPAPAANEDGGVLIRSVLVSVELTHSLSGIPAGIGRADGGLSHIGGIRRNIWGGGVAILAPAPTGHGIRTSRQINGRNSN
ncbi:MAG: hypothetical protein Q8L36_03175 [bacterium]|nr:hypothetical protein [bacterium]